MTTVGFDSDLWLVAATDLCALTVDAGAGAAVATEAPPKTNDDAAMMAAVARPIRFFILPLTFRPGCGAGRLVVSGIIGIT